MHINITARDYIYLPIIIVILGAFTFSTCHYNKENREHKRDIKALEKINARNAVSIDSLKASVAERDKTDSVLVSQIKDLYITTTNENATEILTMPADSFLIKFSRYISAGAAIN